MRFLISLLLVLLVSACASSAPEATVQTLTKTEALAQVDALQPTEGIDRQTLDQLKAAMRRSLLAATATRYTSATPSGAAGAVTDLQLVVDGSDLNLAWTYANRADYDQNRQVSITDLSTLGANLGKGSASPDWLSKARVADGDTNMLVTISDLTPIGASLLATVDGYWVQSSATPSDAASWSDIQQVTFEDSVLEAGNPFKRFSFTLVSPQPGTFYRVRPYNGETTGPVSNYVQLGSGAPDITDVQPQTGAVGAVVQFTPTITGSPVSDYAWDFGNGAVPNTTIDPSPTVTLGAAGSYSASLTVTGDAGSDTFNFTLAVVAAGDPPHIDDVQPQTGWGGGGHITPTATLSGGTPDTYAWDFGAPGGEVTPNTSSDPAPDVLLTTNGDYNASLTVGNADGTDTFNFVLHVTSMPNPPHIDDVQPQTGWGGGGHITPTATLSGGTPDTYAWDFGAPGLVFPNTSTEPAPEIVLSANGDYNASLTVSNSDGTDTFNFVLHVTSMPNPPHIDDVQPQTGWGGGGHITPTATLSGGTPDTYAWDFGAPGLVFPNTSTEPAPEIVLSANGDYNASLTVSNSDGTDTFNFVLHVTSM